MEYFSTKNQWIFVPPRNHLCIESEQNPTLWTTKLLNPRGLQNNSTMENLNFDTSIFFRVTFWSWIGYFLQDLWRFPSLQISANFTASHSSVRMSNFNFEHISRKDFSTLSGFRKIGLPFCTSVAVTGSQVLLKRRFYSFSPISSYSQYVAKLSKRQKCFS